MSKASKATKVPLMHHGIIYSDWKKEVAIWEKTNLKREVNKSVIAGQLFESLKGKPRSIVLSELSVDQISNDDGVNSIIDTLDKFFKGDTERNAFEAYDELMNFKRKLNMNVSDFLVEFKLKVNKVKAEGITLSDGVLGYILLNSANLHSNKLNLIRATCSELDFEAVKVQIKKIGFDEFPSSRNNGMNSKCSRSKYCPISPSAKVEEVYFGQSDSNYSHDVTNKNIISHKQFPCSNSTDSHGHTSSKPL